MVLVIFSEDSKKNFGLLQALLAHPAVLRQRQIIMSPVNHLKNLPDRLKDDKVYLLISATAIGGSATAYLATDDISRSKSAINQSGIPTSPLESRAEVPKESTAIIKFFRSFQDLARELKILSYLQLHRESFGPRIIGANLGLKCILYERLDVAEQGVFFNEHWKNLDLTHFERLLSELEFMHSHGIIHQDIRKANVGFRKGEPVLMDFAFSRVLNKSPFHQFTLGTFTSPLFRLSELPNGYCGTRETASDRIMNLLAKDPKADVRVTKHDDLCSMMKLWYLSCPGVSLVRGVKSWVQLRDLWWLCLPLEEMNGLSAQELCVKLRHIFTTRSGDYSFYPVPKRQKTDHLEPTRSVQFKLAELYDDFTEDRLIPETDYLPVTRFIRIVKDHEAYKE